MSDSFNFDFLVIGGGSGGVRAARLIAQNNIKTIIVEKNRLGGTCVNVGCIPKKLMVYGAHFRDAFEDSEGFGWHIPEKPIFIWQKFMQAKNKEIARLNGLYENNLKKSGAHIIKGHAQFEDNQHVRIGEKIYAAKKILIATGGKPTLLDIPGKEYLKTSDDIFTLPELPKTMLILGSGYIAIEFAGIFTALGVKVTLACRKERFLRNFDAEAVTHLAGIMEKNGIDFVGNAEIKQIEKSTDGTLKAYPQQGKIIETDFILSAIGRSAQTDGLELQKAGIQIDKSGFIETDQNFRTTNPSVFAIGDATRRIALTPVAISDAMIFAEQQFGIKNSGKPKNTPIPTAIFSSPPFATIGPSEEELKKEGISPLIYKSRFRPLKASVSNRDEPCFIKILVHPETKKLLACHIIGEEAPEIIQILAIAIGAGLSKDHLDATLAVHPTMAEEIVTLYQASA